MRDTATPTLPGRELAQYRGFFPGSSVTVLGATTTSSGGVMVHATVVSGGGPDDLRRELRFRQELFGGAAQGMYGLGLPVCIFLGIGVAATLANSWLNSR